MKLWALVDNNDCECHGVAGIFTSKEKAVEAVIEQYTIKTKQDCYLLAKLEGYTEEQCHVNGQPPYRFAGSSWGKTRSITFESAEEDYTGHFDLVKIETDELFDELL